MFTDRSAKDVLEEQNASAVQSILDSCSTKHKKQTDSNSEQGNLDRSESDKENENNKLNSSKSETNCSNLLQTAMMNCDINSTPPGSSSEKNRSQVDEDEDDHQPPMDLCFIDVTQVLCNVTVNDNIIHFLFFTLCLFQFTVGDFRP